MPEEEKDFGEIVAYLISTGLSDQEIYEHLAPDSRDSDLIAFIRIKMEKGYDDPFPQGDLGVYLEIARTAMDVHLDTLGQTLDLAEDELDRLAKQLEAELNPPKPEMVRHVEEVPCIQISAKDWIDKPDVAAWIAKAENYVPQLWTGDFFTIYDNGEGPHCPDDNPGSMPRWLWNEIEKIMCEKELEYAVIRFMNYEA